MPRSNGRTKRARPYWRVRVEAMHTVDGRAKCIASTTLSFAEHEITFRELLAALCAYFKVAVPDDAKVAIKKLGVYMKALDSRPTKIVRKLELQLGQGRRKKVGTGLRERFP